MNGVAAALRTIVSIAPRGATEVRRPDSPERSGSGLDSGRSRCPGPAAGSRAAGRQVPEWIVDCRGPFRWLPPGAVLALALSGIFPGAMPPSWGAAEETPPPPPAAATAEARELVGSGRFDEALTMLRPLAERRPVEPNVLFLLGFASIEASRQPDVSVRRRQALLDQAVAALRILLVDRPGLVRVRLELARAFFFQGKDTLAREHFERVLAGGLPPPVVANVQRFLGAIRARKRWSAYFGAALAPDSNIGAASDERIIQIFGLPFRRDVEDDPTTSGVGLSLWTGGEYEHPVGERLRLRAGADVSRREYAGAPFDQTNLAVHAGPRWLIGERTDLSLLGSARRRLVAGDGDHDSLGGRLEARRRITPRVSVTGRASWDDRRFRVSRHLDGPIRDLSLAGSWVAAPTVRIDGALGYGAERPDRLRFRSASRWFRVGARIALPRGFAVGASGQLRWTDFEGEWPPHTLPGERREDRTRTFSVAIHHRRFTIHGFSPELVVTNESRTTNAQLYDYRKNAAELRFVRQF